MLLSDPERPGRVVYGVASGDNTVAVRGSATAVEMPALTPVRSGDYCAVWEQGADRLILGPVGGVSDDITGITSGTGWTATLDFFHRFGPMAWLRVTAERTGANLAAGNVANSTVATLTGTGATGSFSFTQALATANTGPVVAGTYQASTGIVQIAATATGVNTSTSISLGGCVLLDV